MTSFKVDDFAAYERQTRRLLEAAIGGDRREDKPAWWRYFYLRTLSPAELTGEPDAQILELVAQGRAVGITGPSHAVICHVDLAHTWWWNTWNSTVAKSTGTLWVDNCIPNCALGKGKLPPPVRDPLGREVPQRPRLLLADDLVHVRLPDLRQPPHLHFSSQGGTVPGWH